MSMFYLVLALLFSLLVAIVAMVNSVNVTLYYLFGHVQISLVVLILVSACAGAFSMGSFALFRSIKTHLKFREEHIKHLQLQDRLNFLEKEKITMETDFMRQQQEHEASDSVKEYTIKQASPASHDTKPSID